MRSSSRDQNGFFHCSGKFVGGSALPLFNGELPFSVIRAGAGQYVIKFDLGLMPISVSGTNSNGPCVPYGFSPGSFGMNATNTAGALTDGDVSFVMTARQMSV